MMTPQRTTMAERKIRGPSLRMITVAGIWKMVYVMKKTNEVTLYPLLDAFMFRSGCILEFKSC